MNQLNPKQTTLKSTITISGVGLHTGANVTLTLNPAAENHGYKFRRVDLEGSPIIEADCDLVTDTSRGTTLTKGNASVSTVEHVLAALVGMEVDNVLIDIDGPEMPIMDGSSRPFVDFIEANEIDIIYSCGPMGMLEAINEIAEEYDLVHQCSIEESMACGIGVCMTCVLPIKGEDGQIRMLRSCIDGPVVDGESVIWKAKRTIPEGTWGAH